MTTRIRLEAASICQLRCPSCPTTKGAIHPAVGSGFLSFGDFKSLVDANPQVREIELSNFGEILLNPDLLAILEYAAERDIAMSAGNGVNLNTASDTILDGLVKHGVRRMTCSIDGASEETYQRYRIRGSFERVIANVRRINHYKTAYGSSLPELTWQFVAFGHNEHEIDTARAMATELGMRFKVKLNYDADYSPVTDQETLRRETGAATREEFRREHGREYLEICHQLWDHPQINWDGKVLGCCRNHWGDFGANAFTDGLEASLNSERMVYARDMVRGKVPERADIPCTTCDLYIRMRDSKRWLARPEVAAPESFVRRVVRRLMSLPK